MPVITLTSDLGTKDHYTGSVKGAILSNYLDARIVDISHEITPFNIIEAAFVLKNAYPNFPAGSVHIVSVNSLDQTDIKHLLINHDNHYFIGPDNGLFALMFDAHPQTIIEINGLEASVFPLKDIYAPTAAKLIQNTNPASFGSEIKEVQTRTAIQPIVQQDFIRGTVIYIDAYENVITNITKQLFEQSKNGREPVILFKRYDSLKEIDSNYNNVPEGEMMCLFNTAGYLEIAINKGKASSLLGLDIGDTVQIDFS
ncbi:MAG: SAM-dependent chlorinase/fluorinase [Bacteroidetes bacterium]|nr:SAM-dependent chlorinase/fluorinase [Bacteroidota bacterium]